MFLECVVMPLSYILYCHLIEPSDEVGFVHPSQFFKLNEEAGHSLPSSDSSADGNSVFWNEDHKLGISTQVLLPLYKASKDAFMTANRQFKELNSTSDVSGAENSLCTSLSLDDSIESAVMKHSRALLLLSCDFGTAWHSRSSFFSFLVQLYLFSLCYTVSWHLLDFVYLTQEARGVGEA